MIDPATVMKICDAIDEAGRVLGSIAAALLIAITVIVTGALFLGLAIRWSIRTLIRRFASGKI